MKKLWNVLILTLAMNFLAAAGGVGWLYQRGAIDKNKIQAIKAILFPPPPMTSAATTQPATQPTTRPMLKLEELLDKYAGRPPAEQLDYIRRAFDSQMAQLDRAYRGLMDLRQQVELAQQKLDRDRLALEEQQKKLQAQEQESQRLAADKGFQDSLNLYQSMPAKQVKSLFMTMDDDTLVQYLQAMDSRAAAKIIKEFKTPQEVDRLKRIMDRLRQAQTPTTNPAQASVKG
jgi:flagellar motility protein MotE (MotC chaperone)